MPTYNKLAYLAFRVNGETKPPPETFMAAGVPNSWRETASRMHDELKRKRNRAEWRLPTDSLDNLLMACVPQVSSASNQAWQKSRPWLYSLMTASDGNPALDSRYIRKITRRWAKYRLFEDPDADETSTTLADMFEDDLNWQPMSLDPSSCMISSNNTAKFGEENWRYRLLPHVLAQRITRAPFQLGNRESRFYIAPRAQREDDGFANGVELIEWPPRPVKAGAHRDFWSLVFTVSVQTAPFQPFMSFHCNLSIRRWVDIALPPEQYLGSQRKVSACLFYTQGGGPCFLVARANRSKNHDGYQWSWRDQLGDLLPAIGLNHRIPPEPQQLLERPLDYLEAVEAGVIYTNYMQRYSPDYKSRPHEAGTGVSPRDRRVLLEQLAERMAPEYIPLDPSDRCSRPKHWFAFRDNPVRAALSLLTPTAAQKRNKPPDKAVIRKLSAHSRQLVGAQIEGALNLLILYQEQSKAKAIVESICKCFGFIAADHPIFKSNADANVHAWKSPELTVHVSVERLGNIGAWDEPLESGPSQDNRGKRRDAIAKRATQVQNDTPAAKGLCGAFVEIRSAAYYSRDTDADPKQAIRLGMARAGWAVQFTTVDRVQGQEYFQAVNAAVLDLLRQLGIRPPLHSSLSDGNPRLAEIDYVGLYLHKLAYNLYLPVCVRLKPASYAIEAIARGMENWASYREFQCALANGAGQPFDSQKDKLALGNFVMRILDETRGRDTVLTLHKNTLTDMGVWKWLNNDQITLDQIGLGEQLFSISRWPKLRIVCVHDAGNDYEVPQSYTKGKTSEYGYGSGLFRVGPRHFRSVAAKPAQIRQRADSSKYLAGTFRSGDKKGESFDPAPTDHAWNPIPVDILVAGIQEGDVPEELAYAVHELRSAFVHWNEQTRLPAHLHLAKQVDQYFPPA